MQLSDLSLRLHALSVLRGVLRLPLVNAYAETLSAFDRSAADFADRYGALCAARFACGDISRSFLNLYDSVSSGTYSNKSPGWQSSAAHNLFNVSTFTAFAFPFFRIETFAIVIPSFSESSVTLIFRFASITSMLKIISSSIVSPFSNRKLALFLKLRRLFHQMGKTGRRHRNCDPDKINDQRSAAGDLVQYTVIHNMA